MLSADCAFIQAAGHYLPEGLLPLRTILLSCEISFTRILFFIPKRIRYLTIPINNFHNPYNWIIVPFLAHKVL